MPTSQKRFCPECFQELPDDAQFCPVHGDQTRPIHDLPDLTNEKVAGVVLVDRCHTRLPFDRYVGHPAGADPVTITIFRENLPSCHQARGRFNRAAELLGSAPPGSLLHYLAWGETDHGLFFHLRKAAEGVALSELMEQRAGQTLSPKRALRIALALTKALESAHAAGVTHGCLVPECVYLAETRDGDRVSLVDYSFACLFTSPATHGLSDQGMVSNILSHLSPEQLAGSPPDVASDIYSLGTLMYLMLAGTPPLTGNSPKETLRLQIEQMPEAVVSSQFPIPPELNALLMHMLAKTPKQRPRSMRDIRNRIEMLLRSPAMRDGTIMEMARVVLEPDQPDQEAEDIPDSMPPEDMEELPEQEAPRGRGLMIGLALAAVLLISFGLALVFMSSGKDQIPEANPSAEKSDVAVTAEVKPKLLKSDSDIREDLEEDEVPDGPLFGNLKFNQGPDGKNRGAKRTGPDGSLASLILPEPPKPKETEIKEPTSDNKVRQDHKRPVKPVQKNKPDHRDEKKNPPSGPTLRKEEKKPEAVAGPENPERKIELVPETPKSKMTRPDNMTEGDFELALSSVDFGLKQMKSQRYELALENFRNAKRLGLDSTRVNSLIAEAEGKIQLVADMKSRGLSAMEAGDYRKALEYFEVGRREAYDKRSFEKLIKEARQLGGI